MDNNFIAERIKQKDLLGFDDASVWEQICNDYPFFSIAQWMRYASAKLQHDTSDNEWKLHLTDPFSFARFMHQLNQAQLIAKEKKPKTSSIAETVIDVIPVETEVINSSLVEQHITSVELPQHSERNSEETKDILELIQDLPDTSLFERNGLNANEETEEGIEKSSEISKDSSLAPLEIRSQSEIDKSLMVMMSFTEWLFHFKAKSAAEKQEVKEKKALKAAWQKEKLAEAADEELEEIPEPIFKQAMDSISLESSMISEALAEILAKQGKKDKAVAMYKKLSLRNPEKNIYFANRIQELNLNSESL